MSDPAFWFTHELGEMLTPEQRKSVESLQADMAGDFYRGAGGFGHAELVDVVAPRKEAPDVWSPKDGERVRVIAGRFEGIVGHLDLRNEQPRVLWEKDRWYYDVKLSELRPEPIVRETTVAVEGKPVTLIEPLNIDYTGNTDAAPSIQAALDEAARRRREQ